MAKLTRFFNLMFEQKASDLHLSSGNPPMLRINGELQRVDFPPLDNDAEGDALRNRPGIQNQDFEETGDVDFGYEIPMSPGSAPISSTRKRHRRRVPPDPVSKVLSFEDFEKFDAPLPRC
jgi:Tfp pilus assembly ATPase PilU